MLEDQYILKDLLDSEVFLKKTTSGFKSSYLNSPTTNWYKGLNQIDAVIAELKKRIAATVTLQHDAPLKGAPFHWTITIAGS